MLLAAAVAIRDVLGCSLASHADRRLAIAVRAGAPSPRSSINLGTGEGLTARVLQLAALITVLSLAPSILIMTTSFVRIVVVLSLLRTAIGLQQAPPNVVIVSLSLFLTAFVMQPVWNEAYQTGHRPGDARGNAAG